MFKSEAETKMVHKSHNSVEWQERDLARSFKLYCLRL